jgi:PIN domain nuclease of toxin-antitoxin system
MELAQMATRGEVGIPGTPAAWLRDLASEASLGVGELTADVAAVAAYLPERFPSDPFDRLIAATAIVERAPQVTADRRIQESRVLRTIW